ncbi:MAG: discoidin domain-containing protein [Verrucomicrobiaceae bacterium]|nr:discoidin domain-containing protein [Verrucomicrobiaceae bacterium]
MQAKIIDFGLARAGLRARKQTEDQEGTVMGSIFYMAPEQLSREPVDERTDLYSLGCVFYEALSGKKAFDGETMNQVIDKHLNHDIIPLHVIAPHVPAWLGAWCMRLMAHKPDDRPTVRSRPSRNSALGKNARHGPLHALDGRVPSLRQSSGLPAHDATGQIPGVAPDPVYYEPVAEAQPVYAEPVYAEPVYEAQSYVETAAITTPLAPAPAAPRPTTASRPVTPAPGRPARPTQQAASSGGSKKWLFIGIGAAAALGIGFYFLKGGSGSDSSGPKAPSDAGPPPKVSFQLPIERSFPPVDRNLALFHVATTGTLSNRKGSDGKPSTANTNDVVIEWRDLSERGQDNIFRASGNKSDFAPKLVTWPQATNGSGGPKPDRKALDFHARNGKPTALALVDPKTEANAFPFGKLTVLGDSGLCAVAVCQADAEKLPMRVFSTSNDQGDSATIRIDKDKNYIAELKHGSDSATITSKDVNATVAGFVILTWNANGDIELRARDANEKTFSGTAKLTAPASPLKKCNLGATSESSASADQFNGYLGEFLLYAGVLKSDQIQLLDSRIRDYYLQRPPPAPLNTRLKTKLAQIDPRKAWKVTASHKPTDAGRAIDDNQSTRWNSGTTMRGGEWFSIELPVEANIAGIALDCQGSKDDYARKLKVEISQDGKTWSPPAVTQENRSALHEIVFSSPQKGRFVKITQLGATSSNSWSLHEVVLFKK